MNGYDLIYTLAAGIASPYWLIKPSARRKVMHAFDQRMGWVGRRDLSKPAVMIHAVSLGEINAARALVQKLSRQRPELHFILSTTTETGHVRGQELYGKSENVTLIRYPLDFSRSVARVLDAMKPDVIVLMELEVWPNFMRQCARRGIPVVLANGRLTVASFRRYRWIKPIAAKMFRRLSAICVQDRAYGERFIALGAQPEKTYIAGTMKFDTAEISDHVPGTAELAKAVGLQPGREPIWVCGSTGPGEEEIILRQYRNMLGHRSRLRLVIVPRKPERFDEVAELIERMKFQMVRRSRPNLSLQGPLPPVILGDTMGELQKFYNLADVVFVGRSLVDLGPRQHGSDMIEPAALGKPILVGPHTGNFAEAMNRFREAEAILVANDEESLREGVSILLSTPTEAASMGRRAQEVVQRNQGATDRHVRIILGQLKSLTD